MKVKQHLIATFYMILLLLNCIVCSLCLYVFFLIKLIPIKPLQHLCRHINNNIAYGWVAFNLFFIKYCLPTKWDIDMPNDITPNDWYLIMSNHQCWLDIVVLQIVFHNKTPFLKFFIKDQLKWVPLLGLVWVGLEYPLMKRYSKEKLRKHPQLRGRDIAYTKKRCEIFKDNPTAILNFVEGTRFTQEKRSQQQSPYRHLLKPRAGGIAYVLTCMKNQINHILDITIAYPDGIKSLWQFLGGTVSHVKVTVRREDTLQHHIKEDYFDDPASQNKFRKQLNDIWAQKDILLTAMKKQSSPTDKSQHNAIENEA